MIPEPTPDLPTLDLKELERAALIQSMRLASGRIAMAAELCGLGRCAMRRRLERHGLKLEKMCTDMRAGGIGRATIIRRGARRCGKCPAVRTTFELDNWPCTCGRSEVRMELVARWPTGQRVPVQEPVAAE